MPSTQLLPRRRTDGNVPTLSIKFCSSRLETAVRGCTVASALQLDRPQAPCAPQNAISWEEANEAVCPRALKINLASSSWDNGFYTTVCSNTDLKDLVFIIIEKCAHQLNLPSAGGGQGSLRKCHRVPRTGRGQDAARRGPSWSHAPLFQVAQS